MDPKTDILTLQGFERTGTTGRHVRWILPSDIYLDEPNIEGNDEVSEEKGGDDEEHESEGGSIHVDAGEGHLDVDQDIENQISSFDVDHGDDDDEMASQGIDNE